jgi:tetratricopeptide (TPR) repeat protein
LSEPRETPAHQTDSRYRRVWFVLRGAVWQTGLNHCAVEAPDFAAYSSFNSFEGVVFMFHVKLLAQRWQAVLLAVALLSCCLTQARAQGGDIMLVLPFENNTPGQGEFNWVGESFADALSELLNVPGLVLVTSDERESAYRRMGLPLSGILNRATAIKLARESGATLVVVGKYDIIPPQGETLAALQVTARIIRVGEGRMAGQIMPDGRWAWQTYDIGGALTQLQNLHGRLAYQVLYQRDKALPYSQFQIIQNATKVPQKAFEYYIQGTQTKDLAKRERLLQAAMTVYEKEKAGEVYPQAAFELGELYLSKSDWKSAADYFSKLDRRDRQYIEASFKAATCYWRLNDMTRALSAIVPLTNGSRLTSVYNNAGAFSIQAARDEKDAPTRKALLEQATRLLKQGAANSNDAKIHFNYGYALFLSGQFADAAKEFQRVIELRPEYGHAYFLYSKTLEQTNQAQKAAESDNLARSKMGAEYARWQQEWAASRTTSTVPIQEQEFNRDLFLKIRGEDVAEARANVDAQDVMAKARELYDAGVDEEALAELRRVLTVEPMNADAYLLIGLIQQRQANLDQAISALKTALFWNSKMTAAHIMLGRIFLDKNDCPQALTYSQSALKLEPNNAEALALQRAIDTGGCR